MASGRRSRRRRPWLVAVLVAAAVVSGVGLIAWRDKDIDIPGIEDDAIPLAGEDSRPPYEQPSKEELAAYLSGTPVPEARTFKVGKLTSASRRIPILTDGGYCVGDRRGTVERIDHFDIDTSESAITIKMFVTQRRSVEDCAGIGLDLIGRADLGEPLGDRVVLDGSKDPPRQPRQTDYPFPLRWDGGRPAS